MFRTCSSNNFSGNTINVNFNLFKRKNVGPFIDIAIPGLNTNYIVRRRNAPESEEIDVRILLANEDAVYTVYGISHTPFVSAVSVDDVEHPGEKVPAIMLSNLGKKKLKLEELQILVDYEMMRWSDEAGRAWTNSQPGGTTVPLDPEFPNFYAVYEASTKTRKIQLVAEHGKVARRAFLKNEKSLLTIPKEAYRQAAKCRENEKRIEAKLDAERAAIDTADTVVDLASAIG